MLSLSSTTRIYLCTQPTDMRKGFDLLAAMVRDQFGCDPLSGHLFVFPAKGNDRVKLLWWDRTGFALYYKRLEQGNFKFPKALNNNVTALEIDATDMMALLSGFELVNIRRQLRYEKEPSAITNEI